MTGPTRIIAEPGVPQIVVEREFAAPPRLLYRAHVEPELITRWLGPRSMRVTVEAMELRPGGRWRFVHWDEDGRGYGFHGVHHGTPSVAGIVRTYEADEQPGPANVYLNAITFQPRGARTLLRQNTVLQSVALRDSYVEGGMEVGLIDGMDRLDALMARIAR